MADNSALDDAEYPPYPYTAEECRESFVVRARTPEEMAFSLHQDLYSELAEIWRPANPATHAEAAANILRVLAEQVERITAEYLGEDAPGAKRILEAARAADEAVKRGQASGKT
ncbi:hypothetical protein GCM10023063_16530 [Arthrobacter methylotrophus]|uniref:DUF2742 domain-containing protein n=1 Tax=Arthrobacter methylotrophus TaxID=121291 RepID=A0ABV5UP86_9MICC